MLNLLRSFFLGFLVVSTTSSHLDGANNIQDEGIEMATGGGGSRAMDPSEEKIGGTVDILGKDQRLEDVHSNLRRRAEALLIESANNDSRNFKQHDDLLVGIHEQQIRSNEEVKMNLEDKHDFSSSRVLPSWTQSFWNNFGKDPSPTQTPTQSPVNRAPPQNTPRPTLPPTESLNPTSYPSSIPSESLFPSNIPSNAPTISRSPTMGPSNAPSDKPTFTPTRAPSISSEPSCSISRAPSTTLMPSLSMNPSAIPSANPTSSQMPTLTPTNIPSYVPSSQPTNTCPEPPNVFRTCFQRAEDPYNDLDEDVIIRNAWNSSYSPYIDIELEELVSGYLHLALIMNDTDQETTSCNDLFNLEEFTLKYLRDNVGNNETFIPVCVFIGEVATWGESLLDSDGKAVGSIRTMAFETNLTFVFEKDYLEELEGNVTDDESAFDYDEENGTFGHRNLGNGGKNCTGTWKGKCCSTAAITNNVCKSRKCKKNGCKCNKCPKPKNSSGRRRLFQSSSSDSDAINITEDFFGKNFTALLPNYTVYRPIETDVAVDAQDTSDVASCSANRFASEESEENSFSCEDYATHNCAENEDVIFDDNDYVCVSASPSMGPSASLKPTISSAPSSMPTITNYPTFTSPPTAYPSLDPTLSSSLPPSMAPSGKPSDHPSTMVPVIPSLSPSQEPTMTSHPTPTVEPSQPDQISSVLFAWGDPRNFGENLEENFVVPTSIDESTVDVSAGPQYSIILLPDGTARSSGLIDDADFPNYGQLGVPGVTQGTNPFRDISQVVETESGDTIDAPPFKSVFAGFWHSVLIDINGKVWTTGRNDKGALCTGDYENRMIPHKVEIDGRIVDAAAGAWHTLLLHENGTVLGCGNYYGGLIDSGHVLQTTSPTKIEGLGFVERFSAGSGHSLFLSTDGVHVIGWNHVGQLCIPGGDRNQPTAISDINRDEVLSFQGCGHSSHILFRNGTVLSCGRNHLGQLGDGTNVNRIRTTTLTPTSIKQLGVGPSSYSPFFIDHEGTIYATGANSYGTLGVNDTADRNTPMVVKFDEGVEVEHISSGIRHALAVVKKKGPISAPNQSPSNFPSVVPSITPSISPTSFHFSSPSQEPSPHSTTLNPTYESSPSSSKTPTSTSPSLAPSLSLEPSISASPSMRPSISISPTDTCSVIFIDIFHDDFGEETHWSLTDLSNDEVVANKTSTSDEDNTLVSTRLCVPVGQYLFVIEDSWGDGICCDHGEGYYEIKTEYGLVIARGGEFEHEDSVSFAIPFVDRPSSSPSHSVSPTFSPSFAPSDSPSLSGSPTSSKEPSQSPTSSGQPSQTSQKSFDLYAWGRQIYFGESSDESVTIPTSMDERVIDVSAGDGYSLSLLPDGTACSAGYVNNLDFYRGWLGVSGVTNGINPFRNITEVFDTETASYIDAPPFKSVFAGNRHSVLIDIDGNAWTTGNNWDGELCLGDYENRMIPHKVPMEGRIVDAAVGHDHVLLLHENGTVFGCGDNYYGALGLSDAVGSVSSPTKIEGLGFVEIISAGRRHSLFLSSDGLRVTGYNGDVQLCVDTIVYYVYTPFLLSDINRDEVVSFKAGGLSSYILFKNGTVMACGGNGWGQLGDGTSEDKARTTTLTPAPIKKLGVGPTTRSAFFIDHDGIIYATGWNELGNLGVGDENDRNVPTVVDFGEDVDVQRISPGWHHTIAIVKDLGS